MDYAPPVSVGTITRKPKAAHILRSLADCQTRVRARISPADER